MSDEEMDAAVAGIAARFTLDPATGKWTREHKREKPTTDLVEISSKLVATMIERDNWEKTAADYLDGMHYYRGLVQSIGETIGEAAYLQDDGGKVDSVLCAKVPELVVELKRELNEARQGLLLMAQNAEIWKERAENAFGVKVSDCLYDYTKKSAQLLDATFKARHLQDLTKEAWQEVEKIENQEESK